jgi:hypothetical protein
MSKLFQNNINEIVPPEKRRAVDELTNLGVTNVKEMIFHDARYNGRITTNILRGTFNDTEFTVVGNALRRLDEANSNKIGTVIARNHAVEQFETVIKKVCKARGITHVITKAAA